MDPHPTPFPGKTRRSVATAVKARPEQGKSGAREPNIIAARYNQVPQRRVFGTIRSTNAKVEDSSTSTFLKPQQTASKSVTRTRKTAFVVHTASLKKQYTDNSPKDARQQAAGSADAKKKAVSVSFKEPLPGKSDGCSPKDSKEQLGAVKKHATVSFREPLTGKGAKVDSPTETKKQAGSSERKRNSLTKDSSGSSERKRNSLTKDAGSSGKKRAAGRVAKQVGSFPDVKVPVVVAARVRQPLVPGKRRSVGSATKSGAEEEPKTPAPVVPAAKEAAQPASATPYLSARDCSKCRLDRLETASYWITQIKLAESTGKHFVSAEFFRLAYQCNAEPFRRLKSELSSYVERHLTVSKAWPDVCRLYGLLEDEPSANLGPRPAGHELTKTMEAARGSEDVAALLALEGEVMEKFETSSAVVSLESSTGCEVDSEDSCECCLVPGVGAVSSHSLVHVAADESHIQRRIGVMESSPLGSSVKADIYCDATSSSSDYQMEEEFSANATDAKCCSKEDPVDVAAECHEESDENIKTSQLGETDAIAVPVGDARL